MNLGIKQFSADYPVTMRIKFPKGLSRIRTIASGKLTPLVNVIDDVVENPGGEATTIDVQFSKEGNLLPAGRYDWVTYAIASDGTRDSWGLFYEGEIELLENFTPLS